LKNKIKNAIKKDKISIVLFFLVYIVMYVLSYGAYLAYDDDILTYINYHKFIFFICLIMTIWTHFKCAVTDPGMITHEQNPHMIEFYCQIREEAILRAIKFNETYGKMIFSKMGKTEDYRSDEFTDYDSFEYEAVTSIQPDEMNMVSKQNNIRLKRCDRCYIVRVPGVRHCSKCRGCVLKMDHHCPWVFNCIGQFNQKFFIQFIFYTTIGITEAAILIIYYIWYKNRN
jgi:hypothetical protein